MAARVLNGNEIAAEFRAEVAVSAGQLASTSGVIPGLAAVLVGDDPASAVYVRNKGRACAEAGIFSEIFYWPSHARQDDLLAFIDRLNADSRFHGILVQLPLPEQLDETTVIQRVDPRKDVDGLHPVNQGRVLQGEPAFLPCTPFGVQQLLLRSGYDPAGKHVVIVGRSNIVGKPLAALLMQRAPGGNATVTVCHTRTRDLPEITRQADILVAAMGVPGAIGADMVRKGAVVIDVGINRVDDASRRRGYRLVGDVEYEAVAAKAEAITPVPGGIGPMTIAMLLRNTVEAARHTATALNNALEAALRSADANQ
ncbi:MAG: bifunctional methylenetetrahydrofolate dehydrogenase/methenyltetrahydrofolate cyclohydrolase FolD [Dehalococcoidia bacterium]|nr:bifunctional methylenetetrahydrofolate dehydrogenase/methenyltetrahydrofolate cyclohydrolase FolD [Dehalococcoidia bacterium]